MPPAGLARPARLVRKPIRPVPPVRSGQATLPVGRVPSGLRVGRVPSGLAVQAVDLGPAVLPVGPACFLRPAPTVGLARRLARHVLARRPGNGLLRGQWRIEPGHKVTPRRVLVALSAVGIIPVRHVSTAAYRSLPSTIAAPGPVPGG